MGARPLWQEVLEKRLLGPQKPGDTTGEATDPNEHFGKGFGKPAFGLDSYALPAWVPQTATYNRLAREKGVGAFNKYKGDLNRPLNKLEKTWTNAVSGAQSKTARGIDNRIRLDDRNMDAWRTHELSGTENKDADTYRKGIADPNRPINDMTGLKVSPRHYDLAGGWYSKPSDFEK